MTASFRYKDEAIEYLSIEPVDITTMSQLTDLFRRGNQLANLFESEINNNLISIGPRESLSYLQGLKLELWGYFDSVSTLNTKTVEFNLLAYVRAMENIGDSWTKEESQSIATAFDSTLEDEAKKSFEQLFEKKLHHVRKLGELPYKKFRRQQVQDLLESILEQGFGEKFHWAVYNVDNPHHVNHDAVRYFYYKFLVLNADEYQTQFLWAIVGFILKKISDIKKKEKGADFYFKNPGDLNKVLVILQSEGVIGLENEWIGVKIKDTNTLEEKLVTTKMGILALIDVLVTKHYLHKDSITAIGRAFAKTFKVNLGSRSMTGTFKDQQEFVAYFQKLIRDR